LDATFTANAGVGANASIGFPVPAPNGQHVVVLDTNQWSGNNHTWNNGPDKNRSLMDINIDGTENPNWQPHITTGNPYDDNVFASCIDSQNRIYITQGVQTIDGIPVTPFRIYRLNPNASFDKEFGPFNGNVNGCVVLNDDRILIYGAFTQYQGAPEGRIVFVHADGTKYQ